MKKFTYELTLLLINFSLMYGMGKQPPAPPPPFMSLEATGSPYQAPLFLIDTNSVTIYTQLSFNSPSSVDGYISFEGTKTISSPVNNNKNLLWHIPNIAFNTGILFKIAQNMELIGAIKVDNRENGVTISNLDFGVGFLLNPREKVKQRLDFGISYINTEPTAKYLYIDPYNGDSSYTGEGSEGLAGPNLFASLTIQTAFENWIINPYVQLSYCSYNLFSSDRYSSEVYFTTKTFTITPGITYRISDKILLLAGSSIFIPSKIENLSSARILSGFLQTNFLF